MIEKYFEWKAMGYFVGLGIAIAIVIIVTIGGLVIWTYKKMCESRKKRLDRMMKKWEEEEQKTDKK